MKSYLPLFIFGSTTLGASYYYFYYRHLPPNFNLIRKDVENILWNKSYEDQHIGPLLVRLAWHASGTYDKTTKTGGSNGATMRFSSEANHGANKGLHHAREFLEPIKKKYPTLSYADLWIFASYVAIESMGGPHISFESGRKDALGEKECPPDGRLPDATKGRQHIRDIFYRMGFNDQEIVALVGGGHTIGRCHPNRSGFEGPWTNNPLGFSNAFFKELFDREWVEKMVNNQKQYVDKQSGKLMMLPTDLEFRDDPEFKKYSLQYKEDSNKFYNDFAIAYKKLTELGFKRF